MKSLPALESSASAALVSLRRSMLRTWSRDREGGVERGAGKAECQGGSLVAVGGLWVMFVAKS